MSPEDRQKMLDSLPTDEEYAQMGGPSDNLTNEILTALADLLLKSGRRLSSRSEGSPTTEIPPWFRSAYENT